jgi:hypothetical protein
MQAVLPILMYLLQMISQIYHSLKVEYGIAKHFFIMFDMNKKKRHCTVQMKNVYEYFS